MIRDDEPDKRTAVHHSLADGRHSRKQLPDSLIPDAHKEYAGWVGAYSGQFLQYPEATTLNARRNDLEEHFARNVDYLMRGIALEVTHLSRATLDDLRDFFIKHGLSDENHFSFYKYLLKERYGKENLNVTRPDYARDGIEITRDELFEYHKLRIMFETGEDLNLLEQVSLALDLSKDFVRFCISKKAFREIREALKQKGITTLKV